MTIHLKKRHRLRKKEIKALAEDLDRIFLVQSISQNDIVDMADIGNMQVVLVNQEILAIVYKERPFLSIKGILKYGPQKRYVTVDMGAVKFVYNGADVMAPGVVDADIEVKNGDMVWIRDERNFKPLAIGEACMDAKEMVEAQQGKAVVTIHHVGDDIWNYEN